MIILSHITRILSRVGYVAFTFCPENQTDGSGNPHFLISLFSEY